MKNKILALLVLGAALVTMTGCITTVDGHTRAAVPFRKDKIVSRYERSVPQVFDAAKKVLQANGQLQAENRVNNSLVAKVDTKTIYVKVDDDQPTVTRLTVQVRTASGGADVDLASEIDKQVALELSKGR